MSCLWRIIPTQMLPAAFERIPVMCQNLRAVRLLYKHHLISSPTSFGLMKVLSVKKTLTVRDWDILQELYGQTGFVHAVLSSLKLSSKSLNNLRTFLESYEKDTKLPPVLKCLSLPLYYKHKNECSAKDRKMILAVCKEVLNEYPVLTEEMIECLVKGIILTSSWKSIGLQLLEKLDKIKPIPGPSYSFFISGAFLNNAPGLGWKLMQDVNSRGGTLLSEVYHSIMDHFEKKAIPPRLEDVMKMIDFFEKTSLMPCNDVAQRLCSYFEENTKTWVARFSAVSASGVCNCCSTKLKKLCPTEEEMEKLAECVFLDVLQQSNEFINSSPHEIERFIKFLNNCEEYDVVVDGLNIASVKKNFSLRGSHLLATVNFLTKKGHRVLVVGREHLLKSIQKDWFPKSVQFFLACDLSKDDPFAIYAAVQNGPGTYLVSNDFMGVHFTKIKPHLQNIFRKWQLSSQILSDYNHKMIFPRYSPICQTSDNGQVIHLPFCKFATMFSPSGWLCVQQVSANDKTNSHVLWPKTSENSMNLNENISSSFRSFALNLIDETNLQRIRHKRNFKHFKETQSVKEK